VDVDDALVVVLVVVAMVLVVAGLVDEEVVA
jgi:hypothetical protein